MPREENAKIIEKIQQLKKQREAVILAHNYQLGEVQDIADFVGDSLDLSLKASQTDAKVIVFCGVHFMAETASILCPDKVILLPDKDAGCPMADMAAVEDLKEKKKNLPDAKVICYVNTSAAVKAECDICCTSSNALKVVATLPKDTDLIFVPDRYLGSYTAAKSGREISLWPGYCATHIRITAQDIRDARAKHPDAKVLVHPECRSEVVQEADEALGTGGMINYVKQSPLNKFIIGTEIGMLYRLRKENPSKEFIPASDQAICPNMKLINLEKILWSLEDLVYQVKVPDDLRKRAYHPVKRMLEIR